MSIKSTKATKAMNKELSVFDLYFSSVMEGFLAHGVEGDIEEVVEAACQCAEAMLKKREDEEIAIGIERGE